MEDKNIKVSVVMPVYNSGQFLRPCLDSLIGQTLKELQIIVIDDASTDDSWKVLREYADKDERIVLISNPYNLGAAHTRNIGIQLARGEYISVLDADDYFVEDYLETMYIECVNHDLDVAVCGHWFVDEKSKKVGKSFIDVYFLNRITKVFNYKDIRNYIFQLFPIAPFTKMVKRDFIENYCLEFQDVKYCNDVFWAMMCLVCAKRMIYLNGYFVYYRYNTGSQISTKRGDSQYPVLMVLKKLRTSLELIGRFEEVKQSYYTLADVLINDNLLSASNKAMIDGVEYWSSCGLNEVGLYNLTPSDFLSDVYYNNIEAIKRVDIENVNLGEGNKISVYKKFFKHLRSADLKIGIWGFGETGVSFYEEAIKEKIDIVEIYDKDEKKWTKSQKIIVKSYEDRNPEVNIIIVTNSRYWEEIVREVRNRDESVKIIDFSLFLWYGILRTS